MEFVLGIIVIIAAIYAIVKIINSNADTGKKVLWILLVVILPVIGFIAWYLAGPK
jgi:hypothetical protein